MGKKVLYSAVGGTDPIANFRDGSMLHICRIYKPDEVYLMMSQEISNHHRHDDRYRYCLNKLSEMINHKFNIHVIEYRDLTDVNMFDPVYECIAKDIESIRNNLNEDDILYVNVSSGTPAMKYCLQIISAVSDFNIIPIIVSTPTKKMNKHEEDKENYDFKDYWELNEDNDENEFENRAKETTKMIWDDTKICGTDMQESLNNKYGKFHGGIVYNTHLVAIIKDYIYKNHMEKEKFSECISMLSNVEEELRNPAAHTMVAFDKEKIKKITGNYPEEIYNTIMNLMADLNIPVIKRNSYDEMNLILIDAIDKYNENINT